MLDNTYDFLMKIGKDRHKYTRVYSSEREIWKAQMKRVKTKR